MTAATPPLPLAPSQELLWEYMLALSPHDPTATREVVPGAWRLHGQLDPAAFQVALRDVVARHDLLRLTFNLVAPDPLVQIQPELDPPLETVDVSGDDAVQRTDELIRDQRTMTFDLVRGPLWHIRLLRLSPVDHVLSFVFCHLIADGWACRVFLEDLVQAYRGHMGHCHPPRDQAPGFIEISERQRRRFGDISARSRYWREVLTPLPTYLPFAAREPRQDTHLTAEVAQPFRFSTEMCQRLHRQAWRARTSPYVLLMAAYHLLIARRTGAERVVISSTTLGRSTAEDKRTFGQFTNDVFVSAPVRARDRLIDVTAQVDRALQQATDNLLPYKAVASAVHPSFADDRPWPDNHLFHAYFQAARPDPPELVFPDLAVRRLAMGRRRTLVKRAALVASEVPSDRLPVWAKNGSPDLLIDDDRSGGAILHNPYFYDEEWVRGLVADYVTTVETLVAEPDRTVHDLALRS